MLFRKLLGMIDAVMMKSVDIQSVVSWKCIRIDYTVRFHLSLDDGEKCFSASIRNDYRVDSAISLQQTKNGYFSGSSPTSFTFSYMYIPLPDVKDFLKKRERMPSCIRPHMKWAMMKSALQRPNHYRGLASQCKKRCLPKPVRPFFHRILDASLSDKNSLSQFPTILIRIFFSVFIVLNSTS